MPSPQWTPRNTGKDYCEGNLYCANQSVKVMGSFVILEGDYGGWNEQPKLPWSSCVSVMLRVHIPEQMNLDLGYCREKLKSLPYLFRVRSYSNAVCRGLAIIKGLEFPIVLNFEWKKIDNKLSKNLVFWAWCCRPTIPACWRLRQEDPEFKACLGYPVSSSPVRDTK